MNQMKKHMNSLLRFLFFVLLYLNSMCPVMANRTIYEDKDFIIQIDSIAIDQIGKLKIKTNYWTF